MGRKKSLLLIVCLSFGWLLSYYGDGFSSARWASSVSHGCVQVKLYMSASSLLLLLVFYSFLLLLSRGGVSFLVALTCTFSLVFISLSRLVLPNTTFYFQIKSSSVSFIRFRTELLSVCCLQLTCKNSLLLPVKHTSVCLSVCVRCRPFSWRNAAVSRGSNMWRHQTSQGDKSPACLQLSVGFSLAAASVPATRFSQDKISCALSLPLPPCLPLFPFSFPPLTLSQCRFSVAPQGNSETKSEPPRANYVHLNEAFP